MQVSRRAALAERVTSQLQPGESGSANAGLRHHSLLAMLIPSRGRRPQGSEIALALIASSWATASPAAVPRTVGAAVLEQHGSATPVGSGGARRRSACQTARMYLALTHVGNPARPAR